MEKIKKITALLLSLALLLPLLPATAWATETEEIPVEVVEAADTEEETTEEDALVEEASAEEEVAEDETAAEEEAPEEVAADEESDEAAAASEDDIMLASTVIASGDAGEKVTWTLTSDGTFTVSGTGNMYNYMDWDDNGDFVNGTPEWHDDDYSVYIPDYIQKVVIKSGVTSVGSSTFYSCTNISSVTIADSVTYIGSNAFSDCSSLSSVTIPSSVSTIGDYAFFNCASLKTIYILSKSVKIGTEAIGYCEMGLQSEWFVSPTIYGYTGSTAETYAKNNGITFVPLDSTLSAPTMASITNTTSGVKITWNAVSGATSYNVYRKASGSTSWSKVGSSTTTSYTSTGVTSGVTYTFTVQAVKGSSSSSYGSSTKTIRYLSTPSVSLKNLTGGVRVSWTKSTGATGGYYVYRRTESGSYTRIAKVATGTLTYTDKNASAGVRYYYMVRAYSNGYYSAYASQYITRLGTPTGIAVTNVKSGVQVTWNSVKGATSYEVYRKTSGGSWSKVGTSSTTSYTSTGVTSGVTYTFTVRAVYNSSRSDYNTTGKTIRFLSEPTLSVTNAVGGVKLTWTKSTGATGGYYVYRRTTGGSYTRIAKVATGTLTYTDKNASAGVQYYYAVRAYSNGYYSSYTSKTIVRLGHPTLTLTRASTGVKLTWTKSSNCTGYYIYRKSGTGSYTKIKTITGSGTLTWTDTTAKKGVTYTYAVRAYKGSSQSSYTGKSISY